MTAPKVVTLEELAETVRHRGRARRSVTAIAGAPGAGKSTVADRLAELLNEAEPESAAVLPMDGFHYDDMVLVPRGWRPRKGAPHTFDVAGLAAMLARLRANQEPEIAVPVFDREIEIARAGARLIPAAVRHLIVEGNYLLLREGAWTLLPAFFETTVFLDVPMETLRARLEERWADLEPEARMAKLEENDLPNARLVQTNSRPAEFVLANG